MHGSGDIHPWQTQRLGAWTLGVVIGLALVLAGLIGRVVQLKLAPDPSLTIAAGNATSSRPELCARGDIVDRLGRVIATSSVGYRLFVDPTAVADLGTVALDVAQTVGGSPVEIDRRIARRPGSRYVVLADLLEPWQVEAIERANLRGVGLEPRLVRHYLHPDAVATLVGDLGVDQHGRGGVEYSFHKTLSPQHGRLTYLRDAKRRALWIQPAGFQPGSDGQPVRLTIDLVIQELAQERLSRAVRELNAGGGRAVVLDCATGDILAMCDILNPRKGWDEFTSDPMRKINPSLGRNRCVTDPYEPGSTFKPFIWSVATELGKATLDEVLPTPSPEDAPHRTSRGRIVRDAHYYGPSTWRTVLVKSINAGMAIIAERMTPAQMRHAVARFGFGSKTHCGVPGESPGMVTSAKAWTSFSQVSVSYGHEIAVTPVQMVRAFSAFARGGTLPVLRFTLPFEDLEAIDGYPAEESVDPSLPASAVRLISFDGQSWPADDGMNETPVHRVLPESVARLTKEVMREVMLQGTGRVAQSQTYQLFGKSGTAQLPRKGGKGYHEDRYVASFIAGAPFDEPRLVVLCVIDDPDRSKGHFGGAIAGPVVRDIMDEALTYLGVPGDVPEVRGEHAVE